MTIEHSRTLQSLAYGQVRNQRSGSRGRHGIDCKRYNKSPDVTMVHGVVDQRYRPKKDRRAAMPQHSREHHGPWIVVDRNNKLGWVGLDWVALAWIGFGLIGLAWVGL